MPTLRGWGKGKLIKEIERYQLERQGEILECDVLEDKARIYFIEGLTSQQFQMLKKDQVA